MQRCKSAYGRCKSGKVNTETGWGRTDYRLRITEYGGKVGAWLCPYPQAELARGMLGQHVVLSLPLSEKGGRGAGCWQANGRDAVAPLPKAEPFPIRQTLTAIRLGQHVVLSLPEAVEKGGAGERKVGAAEPPLYSELCTLNSILFYCCPYLSRARSARS